MLKAEARAADHPDVDEQRPALRRYGRAGRQGERRAPEPLLYSADQLLGRAPIRLRRASDKRRLAAHLVLAALLLAAAAWWVVLPHVFAGPVLLVLGRGHGVHAGDLPSLLMLGVAGRSLVVARAVAFPRV